MTIDIDRLRAFATVVRERGFSRAARTLGKTQSAVSQAVLHLERDLGTQLLVRDGQATRTTEAGAVLLGHAERALSELSAARERLSALETLASGRVAVGTSDTLAYYVLPAVLRAFRDRYGGVELRLDNRPSPATAVEVAEGRLDLGIVTLPLPPGLEVRGRPVEERLLVEALMPHDDVVIFPAGHPLARQRRVGIRELGALPLVLLDRSTGTRAFLDAAFAERDLRPTVSLEMSSVEVVKRLVELGFGVSVVPGISIARESGEGALGARPLATRKRRHIGLVRPSASVPSRAAQAFVDVLREHMGRLDADRARG